MMVAVENKKQIIFKDYIEGGRSPVESDMELRQLLDNNMINENHSTSSIKKLEYLAPDGESPSPGELRSSASVLVQNLYLSCDPYMRGRMRNFHASYIPPFLPGSVIEGFGVCRVVDSYDPEFKAGDYVCGMTGWEEYSLIHKTDQLRKIQLDDDIPLSYHLGLLGMPGFTAYAGFYEVCAPNKGDKIFVSAASGAVGQLVGQLAKLHGCYVVGSAGASRKVELLKNEFRFDEAFNYKEEPDIDAALKRYFPQGIDIYFDNVGGAMLDAALANMRVHARIAVCGMVSQHSISDPQGIHNLYTIISKRVKMQGFLQSDYLHLFPRFLEDVSRLYKQGKIVYIEDMNEGLESAPAAFVGLFSGKNVGKQVIRVTHDK